MVPCPTHDHAILEAVILNIRPGRESDFEAAFATASGPTAATPGYISHQLRRCLETTARYLLLVYWCTLESHTVNFRNSANYVEWKRLLPHFYEPFPIVEHFEACFDSPE